MKRRFLAMAALGAAALAARIPTNTPLDEFDQCMQARFDGIRTFGLSRIVRWPVLGRHFEAPPGAKADFAAENDRERAILAAWEQRGLQVALYVMSSTLLDPQPEPLFHRALKGPGVITAGTPRAEVPGPALVRAPAAEAMRALMEGRPEFLAEVDGWTLLARPVRATTQDCLQCHNQGIARLGARSDWKQGDVLGAVLYLYRTHPSGNRANVIRE